jgi:hypothetical protein
MRFRTNSSELHPTRLLLPLPRIDLDQFDRLMGMLGDIRKAEERDEGQFLDIPPIRIGQASVY